MLQEATARRFRRGLAELEENNSGGFADLPDLLLIDGGKGQLHAVLEVLRDLRASQAIIGLAKEREEIFLPGQRDPLVLPGDAEDLRLLRYIRDEAHRFAVTYHRNIRAKAAQASPLDGIGGIGPKRKQALLRRFGSLKGVMAAPLEELAGVEGMSRHAAEMLYYGLRKDNDL
jgi:excinuclease ABC subunit C